MESFRVDVPEVALSDLRERLQRTRWPEAEPVGDWSQGVPLATVRALCEHWATDYDWRATEARLNAVPQLRVAVDGVRLHVLYARSPEPDALPLLLTHGWPGSVLEFLDMLGPLSDPARHGGDPADAFHVVVPALPGYGFSDKPAAPGWGVERIAAAWAALMARLGHERYGAAGGDWGTSVSACLGRLDPGHVAGLLLVPPLVAPDPATFGDLTAQERAGLAAIERGERDSGYSLVHSTRPQTVGYGLVDSPAGLCAWIVEKLAAWMDCDGDPEAVLGRDGILDIVSMYWLTATAASAARLYWESWPHVHELFTTPGAYPVDVPVGGLVFKHDNPRPSRRWAERRFSDLRWWRELDHGGHFPALECPEVFVQELRAFFRLVRPSTTPGVARA